MDEAAGGSGSPPAPAWRRRPSPGWVQVLALSATETVSWGILYYAFAVFLVPMGSDLGWRQAQLTGAFSLALLVAGLAGIPAGRWLDRHGPRALMTAGSTLAALLVLAWARVESLPVFYLIWVGIGLAMAAVLYEPAFAVVAVWFLDAAARSRALTVLTFVGGFASVIFIPLASWLIEQLDWRGALVVLAALLALATIPPHALLLRARHEVDTAEQAPAQSRQRQRQWQRQRQRALPAATSPASGNESAFSALGPRPSRPSRPSTLRDALRHAAFWWLGGGFFLVMAAVVAVTVHLIPYLQDQGFSAGFAAGAAGLVGLAALPGRLVFTPLGAVVPRRVVAALIFGLEALAIVVLAGADTRAEVLVFVALFGAGFGAITPARAALVADLYGATAYGSISGVLGALITGARALAPVGVSVLVVWWGGYTPVLWFLAALAAAAAVLVLFAHE